MNRVRRAAVVMAVMTAVLGACGDEDDDADSAATTETTAAPATSMSEEEYIAAGSAVCADIGPRVVEAFPDPEGEPDVAYLRTIAGPIADVLEDARAQFGELEPPATKVDGHDELLAALDASASSLRAVLDDDAAAEAMLQSGPPLEAPSAAAARLGFEGCG